MSRTWVTVHFAESLDGRIATKGGQSQWLSGQESLVWAHRLRAEHDAVLIGIGTVLADDPRLTVRLVEGRSPLRVVLDSRLRIPLESQLLTDGASSTVVATSETASSLGIDSVQALGARVLTLPRDAEGGLDLRALLGRLNDLGARSILVEGGHTVVTSFLRLSLVNRLVICIGPKIVGAGIDAIGDLGIRELSRALTFEKPTFTQVGQDVIFDGELEKHPRASKP